MQIDRNDFAKAAVLRMIFAVAEDVAHERQVSAALLDAVDALQKRQRRQEDKARALEEHVTAMRSGTVGQLRDREPTSCRDLRLAGHVLSGFYLVRGADRMETVFCSFSDDQGTQSLSCLKSYRIELFYSLATGVSQPNQPAWATEQWWQSMRTPFWDVNTLC